MLLPCWGIRPQLTTTRASRRTLSCCCCCNIFLNGRVIKLNTLCFITCKSGLDGAFKFAFTGPLVIITTDRLGAVTASAEFNPSPSMPCHYDLLITIISSLDDDPCTFWAPLCQNGKLPAIILKLPSHHHHHNPLQETNIIINQQMIMYVL